MKKSIGKNTLGSGNKMEVNLHGFERSTHDLGYLWRSTMSAGTLVPFMKKLALPGDTFDINLDIDVKTHPTAGPLFGSYKIQADTFLCPIRLYNGLLHNNMLKIGMNMGQVKFPLIQMQATEIADEEEDVDNCQINPSSILAYLGIRGIGNGNAVRQFNIMPLLMYWEIVKDYYANKQEELGAVIHTDVPDINETVNSIEVVIPAVGSHVLPEAPDTTTDTSDWTSGTTLFISYTGTKPEPNTILVWLNGWGWITLAEIGTLVAETPGTDYTIAYNFGYFGLTYANNWKYIDSTTPTSGQPIVKTFDLDNIDNMKLAILQNISKVAPFIINDHAFEPYQWLYEQPNGIPNILSSQEGLAVKTYQSDLLNNWIRTEWVDEVNAMSAVSTAGDEFTIDQLNLAKKVYEMMNRIAISGGSYRDWMGVQYGTDKDWQPENPVYLGSLIRELAFQEVVSNSASEAQPLGTLAGKGIMTQKRKGGKIVVNVDEPSYIIGIVSLTPRIDNSQGNDWDIHLKDMEELHVPSLDQIGFQDLSTERMAWWATKWNGTEWVETSAGKQPAWLEYMTSINETRGNFAIAENEMFMTLNRRYERDEVTGNIKDLTTYIDPAKFNFIFAQTSLDAQNFWVQIAIDIEARRKMSAKLMPNL